MGQIGPLWSVFLELEKKTYLIITLFGGSDFMKTLFRTFLVNDEVSTGAEEHEVHVKVTTIKNLILNFESGP